MPVCKRCRNYVMSFPCPHCGSDESFFDRRPEEFKPIVPTELQEKFDEPPPPKISLHTSDWRSGDEISVLPTMRDKSSNSAIYSKDENSSTSPSMKISDSKYKSRFLIGNNDSEVIKRLNVVENGVKTLNIEISELRKDLQTLLKSQKVIETILTKLTYKIKDLGNK